MNLISMESYVEQYNLINLSEDEILSFQKLLISKEKLESEIYELKDKLRNKCLFNKYTVSVDKEGITVMNIESVACGVKRIPSEDIVKIEKHTHTKLYTINDYKYRFLYDFKW